MTMTVTIAFRVFVHVSWKLRSNLKGDTPRMYDMPEKVDNSTCLLLRLLKLSVVKPKFRFRTQNASNKIMSFAFQRCQILVSYCSPLPTPF